MEFLTWYLGCQLRTWGYGESDIRYRLNHCQGDGVAWYGPLDDADVYRAARRLDFSAPELAALKRLFNKGILAVSIDKIGSHLYDHFNTMSVDVEFDPEQASAFESGVVAALIDEFNEDVSARSRELEAQAYAFLEAAPREPETVRTYERDNVTVTVIKHPLEYLGMEDTEPADAFVLARQLIAGQLEAFDLHVKVDWWGEDGGDTEDSFLCSCLIERGSGQWRAMARHLVAEIGAELREQRQASHARAA